MTTENKTVSFESLIIYILMYILSNGDIKYSLDYKPEFYY